MTKRIVSIAVLFFIVTNIFAQADKVVGYWLTENTKAQVQVYKTENGKYYGKMVWLKEPKDENGKLKVDKHNKDAKLQTRPIMNLVFISHFSYNADDKEWQDGEIYDPESGNTYKCFMWFENNNFEVLNVKGYIGFSFIGRTTKWKREQALRH